jgi:DNA-binding XRE family transcriptional regulator
LRIKHSYSQEKLAEIVCVNVRTIQRIESTGVTSLRTRGTLAQALDVAPEDLDLAEASIAATDQRVTIRRWPGWWSVSLAALCIVLGWTVLAVSVRSAASAGLVTTPAIGGLLMALIGLVVLTRVTPLRQWRTCAVLSIVVVAMVASPPAWMIQALVGISLWAAFEVGILLTRFRFLAPHT